jgi:two-component system, cell cycle sensor histidine kinase and response regulator CckA
LPGARFPDGARAPAGPPRLVLRFAVYAGAALVLAAVGALLLARFSATSSAEDDLSNDAAYVADQLSRDDLAREAFAGPVRPDLQAQLDEFLGRIAEARDLTRASLVDPDGKVTYSTDHSLKGTGGAALGNGMLDARLPVRWILEPHYTRGTLVAERDDATVAAAVRQALWTQALVVVLALLVLYALLIPVFRRVTSALAASEQRLRSLMEQASDAIFVADEKGRLTDVNRKACELLGYTRAELLEKHSMELITIADAAELRTGKSILVERPVRRKDGTFVVGDIAANILDDGRIRTSIRDVTERTRLREAQKLEAVGRFAGGIADEFVELLDTVARHADVLSQRFGRDVDVDEIRSAASAGRSLGSQLLAVGSRQALHPEVLDLNATLRQLHGLLHDVAGERVELVLLPGADVERVYADPAQIHQVIVDLALHARAGMPDGGTLTVETSNVDFSQNGRRGGPHVMLAIGDSGGADEEGGERLALGLAAVYGVVHQSGGSIGVESEPGLGTTVRIYLPVAAVAAAAAV